MGDYLLPMYKECANCNRCMYICKCIKGSGKASPNNNDNKTKEKRKNKRKWQENIYTEFYKSAFSKQSKSDDDKTDGTAAYAMAFILFFFFFFFLVIVKKFSLRFLQLLLLLLFCLYLHLYLCVCSRQAMKRNAHAKEVANKNGYPKNTWCQQSRLACMPTSEQQVEWNSERVRERERVRLE